MFGVALSLFLIFGPVVAFGESGGPFQLDSLGLNGAGAIGLTLFVLGARCGLRRKTGEPKPPPLVIFLFLGFSWVATMQTHADTLYVSSVNSNKVYVISSTGTVTPFATINLLPEGLAFGTNGVLYVGNDGANRISRASASGAVSTFATNVVQPYGLGFDSKANLYAASQSTPAGRIRKITPQGVVTNFGPIITAPYGLAVDAADSIYVSNNNGSIYKITPEGVSTTFAFVNGATGLAFDKKGNLFVAALSGAIFEITPAGIISSFKMALGTSLVGLAFDNDGNLYAANYASGAIYKTSPDGALTTFATVPGNPSFVAVYPPPKFEPGPISIAHAGDEVVLSWMGNFILQSAPGLSGQFSDLLGATSPHTNSISSTGMRFFRLRN